MAYVAPWSPAFIFTCMSFAYLHRSRQDQLVLALHAAVLASGYRLVAVAEHAQLEGKASIPLHMQQGHVSSRCAIHCRWLLTLCPGGCTQHSCAW